MFRIRVKEDVNSFFFNDTATTEIYTLSLHDALPDHPCHAVAPPRRPGARRTGRLVRGRGAHGGRRIMNKIAAHPGRHAHRHHDDPGGPDRHGAHRDNEPDAVLGVRHHAARSADAAVARGSHASHGDPVLALRGDAETARAAHHLRAALPVRGAMKADRRIGGWADRVLLAAVFLSAYPPIRLSAQDSQFGIRGLGTPGRLETVRVRSTGGGLGAFDPLSPLTEASLGDLQQLAGPVFGRLVISAGFTTYLDRTWDVKLRDSLLLRGAMRPYSDELASDGGVTDLRLASAVRVSARFALGAAVHVLSGSTRESATRVFDDTTYHAIKQSDETRYDGLGVSGSLLIDPLPELRLSLFARSDNRLRARLGDVVTALTDLPTTFGGGLRWAPSPSVRLAGTVTRRTWADAGPGAFNTLSWSAGLEVGAGFSPLRVGVRGGQLPFSTGPTAPTEVGFAAGTGRAFAHGRALVDVGVEHLRRTGAGLSERVWTFLFGF